MNVGTTEWTTPQLLIYGDVSRITREGGYAMSDVPQGNAPAASGPCPGGAQTVTKKDKKGNVISEKCFCFDTNTSTDGPCP